MAIKSPRDIQIKDTIANYLTKFEKIKGKIAKIMLSSYLFGYLDHNTDFILKYNELKVTILNKIKEITDELKLTISTNDREKYYIELLQTNIQSVKEKIDI